MTRTTHSAALGEVALPPYQRRTAAIDNAIVTSDAETIEKAYRIVHALVGTRQQHRRHEDEELAAADTIAIDYWRNVIATKLCQSRP